MSYPIHCPKCAGAMLPGFVLDRGHANSLAPSYWQEGAPEKSFWTGIKTRGHQQLPITTYRCGQCGFLESYARETTEPPAA